MVQAQLIWYFDIGLCSGLLRLTNSRADLETGLSEGGVGVIIMEYAAS